MKTSAQLIMLYNKVLYIETCTAYIYRETDRQTDRETETEIDYMLKILNQELI